MHVIRKSNASLYTAYRLTTTSAVVAYGGPSATVSSYIFRSYDHVKNAQSREHSRIYNYGPASEAKIVKVARATSAAPRYFSEQTINGASYSDGGQGMNNPARHVYRDIWRKHSFKYPDLVVSVGTGSKSGGDQPASNEETTQAKPGFSTLR